MSLYPWQIGTSLQYWMIDTDYDNYAYIYGCGVMNDDGTCGNAHAFMRVRSQTPAEEYLEKLKEAAQSTCLSFDEDFKLIPQNNGIFFK